jgi:hypothetical protein
MAYTTFDLALRRAWITQAIAEYSLTFHRDLINGTKNCDELDRKIILLDGFHSILCDYEEGSGIFTEKEIDKIVDTVTKITDICFTEKGLTSLN